MVGSVRGGRVLVGETQVRSGMALGVGAVDRWTGPGSKTGRKGHKMALLINVVTEARTVHRPELCVCV